MNSCNNEMNELEDVSKQIQTKSMIASEEFEILKESLKDSAVITVDSEESLRKIMIEKTAQYYQNREYYNPPEILPLISLTEYEATGYDSREIITSLQMRFSGEAPDLIGVEANTVYIVQFANYSKDVQRALNSTFVADEDCNTVAWIPLSNPLEGSLYNNPYGYSAMKKSEAIQTLETQCLIVAYDMLGREINKYYPARNPANYLWTYYCLQM